MRGKSAKVQAAIAAGLISGQGNGPYNEVTIRQGWLNYTYFKPGTIVDQTILHGGLQPIILVLPCDYPNIFLG